MTRKRSGRRRNTGRRRSTTGIKSKALRALGLRKRPEGYILTVNIKGNREFRGLIKSIMEDLEDEQNVVEDTTYGYKTDIDRKSDAVRILKAILSAEEKWVSLGKPFAKTNITLSERYIIYDGREMPLAQRQKLASTL